MEFIADIGIKAALLILTALLLEHTPLSRLPEWHQRLLHCLVISGLIIPMTALVSIGFIHFPVMSGIGKGILSNVSGIPWGFISFLLLVLWIGIAILKLIHFLLRTNSVKKFLIKGSTWVSDQDTLQTLHVCALRMGFSRRVPIRSSSTVAVPTVVGIQDAEILVPTSFPTWERRLKKSMLSHELAHIRRGDNF